MGRKVLLAVVCFLMLSHTFGVRTYNSAVVDNESAESAPRLYRNVPLGVYASAAPYGAYSFHLPTFAAAPQIASSKVNPVKGNFVNHLTDSYGNKFVGTPQLTTYKIAFPQQYVSLQTKLPEHLAQPLVAASANFQFKQANGQFFGAPYRLPALQGPVATPLHHFPTFGQFYGANVKNFAHTTMPNKQAFGIVNSQQQSTNNKAVFTNTQSHEKLNNYKKQEEPAKREPLIIIGKPKGAQEIPQQPHGDTKFQRIQEVPQTHKDLKFQKIQEVPHSHHNKVKLEVQSPQSSQEEKHQKEHELPHYESKFQIIQQKPHPPQFQRVEEQHGPHEEVQFFQFVEEPSPAAHSYHTSESSHEKLHRTRQGDNSQSSGNKDKLQLAPGKQTVTYINDINGEKTIVELDTKPALPLLDLTLLEPLTFDKPIVPQVQHFLPRINQATYQKLPEAITHSVKNYQKGYDVEKTTSYDSGEVHDKPQNDAPKKKFKKPTPQSKYPKKNDLPKKTTVTYHETLNDAPEIVYEIDSPNYKETVKQKAVSYNKQTQSEPISYTYGSKSEKDPVTYSFSRTSKEPVHIMSIQYHGNGPPSPLIYNFKPEEQVREAKSHHPTTHHNRAENEHHSSYEADDGGATYHNPPTEQYKEHPHSAEEHQEPSYKEKDSYHRENKNYHRENKETPQEVEHENPPKYYSEPAQFQSENINFQPILKEYENNIRLLTVPSAAIKVDPNQHVHPEPKSTPQPQPHAHHHEEHSQPLHQRSHSSSNSQEHFNPSPEPQRHPHHSSPNSQSYNAPAAHFHEKSKRVLIHEETPDERHMLREQMRQEMTNREENSEEDFEKAYKDAAIGFPAYDQTSADTEREIFDPESYGVPPDHVEYDFENTPFQQYQEEGDDFPKEARSSYKDARDKMKQNYYSDYSISKPESLIDRYQNKLNYYKQFKDQKPDYLVDNDEDKKKNKKSAKFTVAPSFDFHLPQERSKSYYGHTNPKQKLYQYDYAQGTPRDSSAYASRPYKSFKSRTSFVEPQFQYGFEPISIPKLDSELAAMASNDSPETEKPGARKKVYKENWYIKKTSTSAGAPAS